MRVMIDTNILISAALFPNGRASQALMKALLPPFQPVTCDYVVDELHRKFQEKFLERITELEAFLYSAMDVIDVVKTPREVMEEELLVSVERRILSGTDDKLFSGNSAYPATLYEPNDIPMAAWATRCRCLFKAADLAAVLKRP